MQTAFALCWSSANPDHVYIGLTDMSGQLRGKYLLADKLAGACDGELGMVHDFHIATAGDSVYAIDGINSGESQSLGDYPIRVIAESCREIPWESPGRNLLFLAEHADKKGVQFDLRCVYGRVLDRARKMCLRPFSACEFEFTVLDETPYSL